MTFDPGLATAGVPSSRQPYLDGAAGIRQSLEAMSLKIREGRLDPAVRGWAVDCLKSKGLDGRDRRTTARDQARAILECLRSATIYTPDPYGAEAIQSAATTLCLRPNLCIRGSDCDDLAVALGSLYMAVGLPVQVVKQTFSADAQEHVLIAVFDGNDWLYADPSTKMPLGSAAPAVDEVWVDPMEPIGNLGAVSPEIVTLGAAPQFATRHFRRSPAPHWLGVGRMGFGQASDAADWTVVTDGSVHQGHRYRQSVTLALAAWPTGPQSSLTTPQVSDYFSQDWSVEAAYPTGDVANGAQGWIIQGVAKTEGTLKDTAAIHNDALAIYSPPANEPVAPPPPVSGAVSLGTAVAGTAVVAVAGGIVVGMLLRRKGKR